MNKKKCGKNGDNPEIKFNLNHKKSQPQEIVPSQHVVPFDNSTYNAIASTENDESEDSFCQSVANTDITDDDNDDIIKNQLKIMKKLDFLMEFITNEPKGEVGSFNKVIEKKF
ncbi:hypothetical protein RF55_11931 [Lasius niger]|uniref:Uncharacterized protein n=1 Tax=Lasius niger TaxID=67767 RepID=A0A0J7N7G2_LASNI|nr:hypothetical protein RF55_11931 [Lasius niger]